MLCGVGSHTPTRYAAGGGVNKPNATLVLNCGQPQNRKARQNGRIREGAAPPVERQQSCVPMRNRYAAVRRVRERAAKRQVERGGAAVPCKPVNETAQRTTKACVLVKDSAG